jgi:RNA polymerase sigma factor
VGKGNDMAVSLDDRAVMAKQSEKEMESLIEDFKPFLRSRAARYSSRAGEDQYEELFSAAMIAFFEAVQKFDIAKGHFTMFADRIVCERIIDSIRHDGRREIQTVPLEDENDNEYSAAESAAIREVSLNAYEAQRRQESIIDEIEQFKVELKAWGISMEELSKQSPKHQRLRVTYRTVVSKVCQIQEIVQTIQQKHYFPIKSIASLTGLPQKTIERARTFIIASLIIRLGDYDFLSEYVDGG